MGYKLTAEESAKLQATCQRYRKVLQEALEALSSVHEEWSGPDGDLVVYADVDLCREAGNRVSEALSCGGDE
jgi:hypothetical protein